MKRRTIIYIVMLFALVFVLSGLKVFGQDVVRTNPKFTKLLADTAGVRMIKVTLAPGEEMVLHTHPVQMMYCIEGGQITVNYKSGKKEIFDIKPGDAMQAPSDPPHTTRNTGTTTLSFLEIEIGSGEK
jgi:mannose-6-phosphate isomerase-like protein (cupin superfamily)